jgi:hypothetical protein
LNAAFAKLLFLNVRQTADIALVQPERRAKQYVANLFNIYISLFHVKVKLGRKDNGNCDK